MTENPQTRRDNIVIQELDGELLIYDLNTNKAFCLNETSALVWQLCDGNKSVSEISQAISEKLNQLNDEDLVWLALDQLKKENLLENSQEIVPNFNGMSRREVIKKVGLGTMVALPVILSLIAPTAAMAQSTQQAAASTCANTGGAPTGTPVTATGNTNNNQCRRNLNAQCCNDEVNNYLVIISGNPGSCSGRCL